MGRITASGRAVCYCGRDMRVVRGRKGAFFGCMSYPECDGSSMMNEKGEPVSTAAIKPIREARRRAHLLFDQLWHGKGSQMSRGRAYKWMQKVMGLGADDAHIGLFDEAQCETLINALSSLEGEDPDVQRLIGGR